MLKGGTEDDNYEHGGADNDAVDVGTTLTFELEGRGGDLEDAEGRDELFKEDAEGLREGKTWKRVINASFEWDAIPQD